MVVVERDNQLGQDARIKRLSTIDPAAASFAPLGQPLPVLEKEPLANLLPLLDAASISVPDKLEGLAVTSDQHAYLVTDNDDVDENYGETIFLELTGDEQRAVVGGSSEPRAIRVPAAGMSRTKGSDERVACCSRRRHPGVDWPDLASAARGCPSWSSLPPEPWRAAGDELPMTADLGLSTDPSVCAT